MKNKLIPKIYSMYKWNSEELVAQFAILLKLYRLRKGLSQFQVGNEVDLTKDYIGLIERNKTNPTIDTIVKIINFLEIDILVLCTKLDNRDLKKIEQEIEFLQKEFKNKNRKKS